MCGSARVGQQASTTSAETSSLALSGLSRQLSTRAGHSDQQRLGAKQVLEGTTAGLRILDFSVQVRRLIADACMLVTHISVQNNLCVCAIQIMLKSQCFVYSCKRL